ncbi:MAG: hypothetical protein PHP06_05845 [Clostridia bacterium]|nr:hypothetical protein [Clostridia bacterium]
MFFYQAALVIEFSLLTRISARTVPSSDLFIFLDTYINKNKKALSDGIPSEIVKAINIFYGYNNVVTLSIGYV